MKSGKSYLAVLLAVAITLTAVCVGCSSNDVDPNAPPPKKPGSIPPPSNLPQGMIKRTGK